MQDVGHNRTRRDIVSMHTTVLLGRITAVGCTAGLRGRDRFA